MTALPASAAASLRPDLLSSILDYGERALLVVLYGFMVHRIWPAAGDAPVNVLLVLAETIVVGFVVCRRATSLVSKHPLDWLLALGGTLPPLFLQVGGSRLLMPGLAAGLMVVGILIQVSAKFFLRRSFGMAAANRGVKIGGPYRFVRHPMYLGYAVTWVGFVAINAQWVNVALALFAVVMQVSRIIVEERLLQSDATYRAYAAKVRYRVIPGMF